MQILAGVLHVALLLYLLALQARLVIDWIQSYARSYRPTGIVLVVFEAVFSLTDPPVRLLRRVIPPLRLGAVSKESTDETTSSSSSTGAAVCAAPDSSSATRLCASSSSLVRRAFSSMSSCRRGMTSLSR